MPSWHDPESRNDGVDVTDELPLASPPPEKMDRPAKSETRRCSREGGWSFTGVLFDVFAFGVKTKD